MSDLFRSSRIPLILIWVAVLIIFGDYFFGGVFNQAFSTLTVEWTVIIANIAIIVGGISILLRSIMVSRRSSVDIVERIMHGWQVVIAVFIFAIGTAFGTTSGTYNWLYTYILLPSWRTVYTIIIFFMATASYRAFRARSGPSFVMLICGILVLLRNAPIGMRIWPGFYSIGTWILDVVNMSGGRAIMIGSVVGAVSLLIRILLGKEKILGESE